MTVTNNQHGRARLGLAVSKKFAARAVDRNRIKRIVRESFRHNARTLKAVDIVVQITPRARSASKPVLHESLEKLWAKI
jgi:ribonuclease P protein component|tara:strand:- start:48 stop:284 length:237 start_codon:yes stop_codon:yes gene_type:complete